MISLRLKLPPFSFSDRLLRFATSACLLVATQSCGDSQRTAAGFVVRDSAGVRIVESTEPLWSAGNGWTLSDGPVVVIAATSSTVDEQPLDPASAYRTESGHYFVADGLFVGWDEVMEFDSAGVYVRSISREGQGPCEFRQLWWAAPYRGDSIAAFDFGEDQISILDADGRCGREFQLPRHQPARTPGTANISNGAQGVFADGSFLIYHTGWVDVSSGPGVVWSRHAVLRLDPSGAVADSLGVFRVSQRLWDGTRAQTIPFSLFSVRALERDGIVQAHSESFEFARYTRAGELRMIVRRAHVPEPVTDSLRDLYRSVYLERLASSPEPLVADARARLDDVQWPELLPAISAMLVDADGYLWVEEYSPYRSLSSDLEPPPTSWSVFDHDGRWIGDVRVPGRLLLQSIGRDHVIGFWRDPDDTRTVQVYSLQRGT